MSPFNRTHVTSYSTVIESMCLSRTVFELDRVIYQKSLILTYTALDTSWAVVWCRLRDPMFSRFYTIPACDGRTGRQTDGRTHDDS